MTDTLHRIELVSLPALAELAQLDQWVIYQSATDKAPRRLNERADKLIGASHSDPAHWVSYDNAIATAAALGAAGVGFVFSDYDPYTGIDLDGCRNKDTGAIEAWAQRIIDMCASYTEISPSGTGAKIFVRGTLPEALIVSFGPHTGIEVYSRQRYFTTTGNHLAGTPLTIADAQPALDSLWAEYHKEPAAKPVIYKSVNKVSPGEAANGRQNARDVIDRLNRANDLGDYLESRGCTLVRTRGDVRYYSGMSGDVHKSEQTYIVSPAKDGAGHIGYSYSPNGKLSKSDFPRGFKFFDATCALDYSGVVIDALKTLNPIAPRPKRQEPPLTEPQIYRTVAQAQDAARKRDARKREAAETIEAVQARASQDASLGDRDQLILLGLLESAGDRDWTRVSVARLAEMTEMCERRVHEALRNLEHYQYIRSGARNGSTTFRTFVRLHDYVKCADVFILDLDLSSTSDLVSAPPPAADDPDAWATFENDACDDSVLAWLYEQERETGNTMLPVSDEPEAEDVHDRAQIVSVGAPDKRGMQLVRWSNGSATWQRAELLKTCTVSPIGETVVPQQDAHLAQFVQDACEASYTPVDLPDRPYTGTSKHALDHETRMAFVRESMRPRSQPPGTVNLYTLGDPDGDDPLVRCPPTDPKAAREYWSLKNKKAASPRQAVWMRRRAAELEVLRPLSEARALGASQGACVLSRAAGPPAQATFI